MDNETNMDSKKSLARIAKNIRESGMKNRITPHLDNEFFPQMEIDSVITPEIKYNIRMEAGIPKLYTYRYEKNVWKVITTALPKGWTDIKEELTRIVKCIVKI